MQRSSQHSTNEVAWDVAAVKPGAIGLDTRTDGAVGSLKMLRNARFVDAYSLGRREGFTGKVVQDGDSWPADKFGAPVAVSGTWVYGHGIALTGGDAVNPQFNPDSHVPIAGRGGGVFQFGGSDVVWTGDRLLVAQAVGTDVGSSTHWTGSETPRGVPAMLPTVDLVATPEALTAIYSATCLTSTLRVSAVSTATQLVVWVQDRDSGAIIGRSVLASALAKDLVAVNSGDVPVLLWREGTELRMSRWLTNAWTTPEGLATVTSFGVTETATGFHLCRISGGTLVITEYAGANTTSAHYAPLTVVTPTVAPVSHLSLTIDPSGQLIAVYMSVGTSALVNDLRCTVIRTDGQKQFEKSINLGTQFAVVTAVCKKLRRDYTNSWPVVAYAESDENLVMFEFDSSTTGPVYTTGARPRTKIASHAFCVGNAPMVWLRTTLASVHYLLTGVSSPQVIAYSDREEAGARVTSDGEQGLQRVVYDPRSPSAFSWISQWAPGVTTVGNTRVGDMEFLPSLAAVQFGESVYLAGSAVRNWDGLTLGDAGFQDYPKVTNLVAVAGGSLSDGAYRYRVYATRVNAMGERFQSPALSSDAITLVAGANHQITVSISTYPSANSDVVFEVYRTEADGTTYYLEGTVANSLAVPTVTFASMMSDADLVTKAIDPHAPGIGFTAELEEFGPVGCAVLVAAGDRLWGAGGQVPGGMVQYSKLKEAGEGAGFDDLGGFATLDLNGGKVTSIAPIASGIAVFQHDKIHVLNGDGPSNLGVGSFSIPELRLADGAATHRGTTTIQHGVLYWGTDGPRLLDHSLRVSVISQPILGLTAGMVPSGVQVDLTRQEVTWFSEAGTAVHLNYQGDPRWSEWKTPAIAGCSQNALVTPAGRILHREAGADDDGVPFAFEGQTNDVRVEAGGKTLLNSVGVSGDFVGDHQLRLRVYYNRSGTCTDEWTWSPVTNTWLATAESMQSLTPAQIDALVTVDRTGTYATHKRVSVPQCRSFRVEWSDISSHTPTLVLHEISYEFGARPGLGRVAVNNFGG